ncbi:PrsW family glutamic-type intramembrane protease [Microbacterium sp. NPDC089189]|uniref:PrsW family intramembrane metalloprotease n=1 Tax=Microbacterium sp. NPDC089189 TaxID=3154972 RepID=UPI00342CFB3B
MSQQGTDASASAAVTASEETPSGVPSTGSRGGRAHPPRRRTGAVPLLLGGIALWAFLGLVPVHLLKNPVLLSTWIVVGAAVVPAVLLWVMAHRLRAGDTLTPGRLVVIAVIGGSLAVALGGTLDSLVGLIPQPHPFGDQGLVSLALAGFVEEFAKGVLIVATGWSVAKTTRNGLFVGGAVGLGFAVLETIGYISDHYSGDHPLAASAVVAVLRGATAPFGHVLWSALLGAALFYAARRTGRFRLSGVVLGAYVGVAVLHGLWDSSQGIVEALTDSAVLGGLTALVGCIVVVLVGGSVWRRIARATMPAD